VTVLFCDLVGSTAFAEAVDPESARDAMARYHQMASDTIERHGGSLAKFIGDGVMALFGVPEVAEDDAERAVAAGHDLQQGFAAIRDHIDSRYGAEVGLRVGINTGEVVIDDNDADLVGDVLNTAARLEGECTPGEVLVGEDTWRLTRSTHTFEVLGEVEVKGKRHGLATFQLVEVGETAAARSGTIDDATPFVGRAAELDRLTEVFDQAVAEGVAKLTTIIGAPGVGKTRLSRELGRALADRADVIELRCERAGSTTFAPIAELIRESAAIGDDHSPEHARAALAELVDGTTDAARVTELLASIVGAAPSRSTEDSFFGARRLVEILAARRPIVLVIDDIQWAEPLFLDLLEHLVRWVAGPAMIVGLARPELREIRPTLAESGRQVSLVVSLEGLDAAATAELAARLLGTDSLPDELAARLPDSTDGNPLFVRELVRMLVDDRVITEVDGVWRLAIDADAVEVPPTIQSLLATRIERLPDDDRRVIELASVIGPEFPLGALVAIADGVSASDINRALDRMRRREQIEPTGSYWGDEPVYRFHHVLIRDAAYRRLLKGARADLHLRIGQWMHDTAGDAAGELGVTIAYHFEQTFQYRRQLGVDNEESMEAGQQAADLLRVAAEDALARDDLAAAGRLALRAVDCLDVAAPELPNLLILTCEALLSAGDVTRGGPALKLLDDRAVGDDRLTAWATCFRAEVVVLTDPSGLTDAAEAVDRAAERLADLDDNAGVAKARQVRAAALARLGRVGDCETELDEALTAARAADDRRRITAVLEAAPVAALWGPSPVPRAGGRCLDVMRLSRITADSPAVQATSVRCQAVLEALRGRHETARDLLASARTTGEEIGLRHGLLETDLYAGIVELLAGDPVAAEPYLRRAYGGLGQLGIGADAGQAAAHLARALLQQGRVDEAEEMATDSDALAGQNPQTAIVARSVLAEVLAVRGELAEARRLAEEAAALAATSDIVVDHANALASLARVREAGGDLDGAREAASSANELYEAKGAAVRVEVTNAPAGTVVEPLHSDPSTSVGTRRPEARRRAPEGHLNAAARTMVEYRMASDSRSRLSARLVVDDRRQIIAGRYQGPDFIEGVLSSMARDGYELSSIDWDDLAFRGERLCLARGTWNLVPIDTATTAGGPLTLDFLLLTRVDDDDEIDLWVGFDADDLAAALAELDRLYIATLDPGRALVTYSHSTVHRRSSSGIPTADGFTRDYSSVDHRSIGWGVTEGRAAYEERLATLLSAVDDFTNWVEHVHRERPPVGSFSARVAGQSLDGADFEDRYHVVAHLDPATGLADRTEQFAEHDVAAAIARADELRAEYAQDRIQPNDAVFVGGRANLATIFADEETFLGCFADGFTATLADGTTIDKGAIERGEVEPTALGYGIEQRRMVRVSIEPLAMIRCVAPDGRVTFVVEEIDDHKRLVAVKVFAADRLWDAVIELDRRQIELLPTELRPLFAACLRQTEAAGRGRSREALRDAMPDGFLFIDHRQLGFGTLSRDEFISVWTSDAPGVQVANQELFRCPAGLAAGVEFWSGTEAVDDTITIPNISVALCDGDRLIAFELYDEGDEASAIARVIEHARSLGVPIDDADLLTMPADAPWNEAHRTMIDWRHAGRTSSTLSDQVVIDDRRSLFQNTRSGKEAWDAIVTSFGVHGYRITSSKVEPVAARDGDLILLQSTWYLTEFERAEPVPDGHRSAQLEVEFLNLARLGANGLFDLFVVFDPDDLAAAVEELDRLAANSAGPEMSLGLASVGLSHRQANRWDSDGLWLVLARDLAVNDHRSLAWGSHDRAGYVERHQALVDTTTSSTTWTPVILELRGPVSLSRFALRAHTTDGVLIEDRRINVVVQSPATGLITSVDQYSLDDLEAAHARFEELAAEHEHTRIPPNDAVFVGGRANITARVGDTEAFLACFADDFTATLADGTTIEKAHLERGDIEPSALGYGGEQRTVVKVTSDRLAVIRIISDGGDVLYAVEETDTDGRLTAMFVSPASSAADALRWTGPRMVDIRPPELRQMSQTILDMSVAIVHGDADALRDLTTPDFRWIDHRQLGFGSFDRADWIEFARSNAASASWMLVGEYDLMLTPFGSIDRISMWEGAEDLYDTVSFPSLAVTLFDGDRLVGVELYEEDDEAVAIARLAEHEARLASEPVTGWFDGNSIDPAFLARLSPTLRDQAHVVADMAVAVAGADLARLNTFLADDFRTDDLRPLGWGPRDRAAFLESVADRPSTLGVGLITGTLHRIVDGAGVTAYEVETNPHGEGAPIVERGIAVMTARAGRLTWMGLYPDDQLDAATARFEEIAAALGARERSQTAAAAHEPWNRADRLTHGWLASDDWTTLVSDEIVIDDRRASHATVYSGRDEALTGWAIVGEMSAEHTTLATRGDDLALSSVVMWLEGQRDVSEVRALRVDRWNADDLLERSVIFDPDDLSAAVVELNRLVLDGDADAIDVGDAALMSALEAITDHDRERSQLHFHPEFEHVDHRAIGWATTDREAFMARSDSLRELTAEVTYYLPRFKRGTHPAVLFGEYCLRGSTELGVEVEHSSLLVNEIDLATGIVMRTDQFEIDDRGGADERMAEIEAAAARELVQPNDAVIVSGAANIFTLTGRHEQFVDRFSDDFEGLLPDGRSVTKFDIATGSVTPEELGFGLVERELFAVDGDGFAAFDTVRDDTTARSIEIIDDTHRIRHIRRFSPGSTAECHEFFSTYLSPASELPFRRFGEALPMRTFPADLLSDDFQMIDHRSIGLGAPDRAAYLDSVEALKAMGGLVFRRSVIRSVPTATLLLVRTEYPDLSGGHDFVGHITLMTCDAEQVTRIEHFDTDGIDSAIARFEDHTS